MANADAPRGLMPSRYVSGGYYDGAVNRYYVPASDVTPIYKGGLVKLAGDADANGVPSVTGNVATGEDVVGVVVAVEPITRDSTIYREASSARYVMVADNPDILFEAQEDSVGGALTSAEVGNVAGLSSITAGSAFTGLSAMEIESATATDAGTGDVQILRLAPVEGNDIGDNANWLVRLNNHALAGASTGA